MSAVRRGDRRAARNQQSSPYGRPNAQPQKSVRPHTYSLPTLPVVGSHPRQSWSLSGFFNFLNPLRRQKPSEEPEEEFSDESAGFDEKQTTDGSDFGASHPREILTQRGHAVRHTHLHIVCLNANVSFHISQIAGEPHQEPFSPLTPARQSQNIVSALTTSGLISETPGATSPFKGSTTLDAPSQSPAEKLEAVKQYLRDRSDQPLHHVEYVGLVSLLKDSVQGMALVSLRL